MGLFNRLISKLKDRGGSLSDRVVEGIDMMGGMPRDMMPRRGSGIMDGMRNRRFFDRFRNKRPRPRPIRSIDKMPVMLEEDVKIDFPDPMAGQPLPPGEPMPLPEPMPIGRPIKRPMPVMLEPPIRGGNDFLPKPSIEPIMRPMPLPEPEPMDPNFGLPFDISLLRPEDRRRFLARQPNMENQLLPPDTKPILRPDLGQMPVKRPRFNEGGIASMQEILGESGRTLSNRDKMLLGTDIATSRFGPDGVNIPLTQRNAPVLNLLDLIIEESQKNYLNEMQNLKNQIEKLRAGADSVENETEAQILESKMEDLRMQKYRGETDASEAQVIKRILSGGGMFGPSEQDINRAKKLIEKYPYLLNQGMPMQDSIPMQDSSNPSVLPQMSEGGAIKLSEQSVEFMPGTDIGIMLDEMSGLKKKAQMMS